MNCQEFSKRIDGFLDAQEFKSDSSLAKHVAMCPSCASRVETERALTGGLEALATEDRKIEAPAFLRNDLLVAFEKNRNSHTAAVVQFPTRTNWARWALAAAATIILGVVFISSPWRSKTVTTETTEVVAPVARVENNSAPLNPVITGSSNTAGETQKTSGTAGVDIAPTARRAKKTLRKQSLPKSDYLETQIASAEVTSEFVPLTYLNDATAMESGIVVRVEIAREELASLGLPFDMERADEMVKADIVLGDDGVARAIRLVQ
jgi:hypothetical protein